MSVALVQIQKTYAGHTWENTHCIGLGTDLTSVPSDADLTTWGCASDLSGAGINAPTTLLQRIIAFEQRLHRAAVVITKVYLTDGKRNRTGATEYFTASLGISGSLANPTNAEAIAPGTIACQINRNAAGYGHRPGRMFVRGMLLDSNVIFSGPKMVDWNTDGSYAANAGFLTTAVNSGLVTHFLGGTNVANGLYCVPRFLRTVPTPPKPNNEGALINAFPVASMTLLGPVTRQARRGRRRKKV